MTRARTLLLATAVTLTVTLAGCGGDGDSATSATAEADVERALRDYVTAMNEGDADAVLASLSERCRQATNENEVRTRLELFSQIYGDIELREINVRDIEDGTARVSAVSGIDALDEESERSGGARWILEDGAWRNDDCDEGADDGADDGQEDASALAPAPELALGETYTWDDDLSLTVGGLREVPAQDIGEYDFVEDGQLPFVADLTITNNGSAPFDLSHLFPGAEGVTNGGRADTTRFEAYGETGYLEGRLAPGETLAHVFGWTLAEEHGREIAIEVGRGDDWSLPAPVWLGTIAEP